MVFSKAKICLFSVLAFGQACFVSDSGELDSSSDQQEESCATRENELRSWEGRLQKRSEELNIQEQALQDAWRKLSAEQMRTIEADDKIHQASKRAIKTQVQTLQNEIREQMRRRGLLDADLDSYGKLLRASARKAFTREEFSTSLSHYTELGHVLKGVLIDKDFIESKLIRVNGFFKAQKLSGTRKKDAEGLLLDASKALREGDFAGANQTLNRLFSLLEAKQREVIRG